MKDAYTTETGTPTCDAQCSRMGWVEYIASNGDTELHLSVAPGADLDGSVRAFCHDEQESILVAGWAFTFDPVINT